MLRDVADTVAHNPRHAHHLSIKRIKTSTEATQCWSSNMIYSTIGTRSSVQDKRRVRQRSWSQAHKSIL
jgi:hypothetical protein